MEELLNQCGPRLIDVSNSCDASLTKANITGMTPGQLVALKDTAVAEAEMYRQLTVARLTGVRENSLYELLMSRMKGIKGEITKQTIGKNTSYFLPYFLRYQEDYINSNNFEILAGVVDPNAGSTVEGVYHPRGSRLITVSSKAITGGADAQLEYTETGLVNIGRYFLPGETVIVLNHGAGTTVNEPVYEILYASSAIEGGKEVAKVVIKPNKTEAWWDAADAGAKAPFEVSDGVVVIGTNSVSDYESWCNNQPVDHSKRIVAHWPQRCRYTHCHDEEYDKYLAEIMKGNVNVYLEKFKEMSLSEQNRKQYAIYQQKLMNSVWYGQEINENQTVEGYKNLPRVNDPRGANSFIEYKANCIGVRTQLANCDRRFDYEGAALNMNVLEQQCYALKRFREVDGGSANSIDFLTDQATAARVRRIFADYYKKIYGTSWQREMSQTEKITFGDQIFWEYQTYQFDETGININIIVDNFFTDNKAAFAAAGISARGNQLVAIDWNDLELGMGDFSRRKTETPSEDDPDFACTIKMNKTMTDLESCQITPILGDPKRSLVIENFSSACPTMTYDECAATANA